jgi:hypothetical protein
MSPLSTNDLDKITATIALAMSGANTRAVELSLRSPFLCLHGRARLAVWQTEGLRKTLQNQWPSSFKNPPFPAANLPALFPRRIFCPHTRAYTAVVGPGRFFISAPVRQP